MSHCTHSPALKTVSSQRISTVLRKTVFSIYSNHCITLLSTALRASITSSSGVSGHSLWHLLLSPDQLSFPLIHSHLCCRVIEVINSSHRRIRCRRCRSLPRCCCRCTSSRLTSRQSPVVVVVVAVLVISDGQLVA